MRKIIVSALLTVDGLVASADNSFAWAEDILTDEMFSNFNDQLHTVDTVLMGRITFEIMKQYCTGPGRRDNEITDHFNRVKKFVFSKSLSAPDWDNTTLLNRIDKTTIRNWQKQPGGDIAVIGSTSIVQAFINLGLINEYHLYVHPLVLGNGKPLFRDIRGRHALTPVKTDTYNNGVLRLCYHASASQ